MTSETSNGRDGATLILRLWREGDDAEPWRCSVEDPLSRQRRGFSSLAELVPFLQTLTNASQEQVNPESRQALYDVANRDFADRALACVTERAGDVPGAEEDPAEDPGDDEHVTIEAVLPEYLDEHPSRPANLAVVPELFI